MLIDHSPQSGPDANTARDRRRDGPWVDTDNAVGHGGEATATIDALAAITARVVTEVPGADFAGIVGDAETFARRCDGQPVHVAVVTLDHLYAATADGPGRSAVREMNCQRIADTHHETRWPVFIAQASTLGVRCVRCLPLAPAGAGNVGVLNVYGSGADAIDDGSDELLSRFAGDAAAVLSGQRGHLDRLEDREGDLTGSDARTERIGLSERVHGSDPLLELAATYTDSAVTLHVAGEVDLSNAAELFAAMNDVVSRRGDQRVLLDLIRVGFISVAGLEAMHAIAERYGDGGGLSRVDLVATQPVLRPMRLLGMDTEFACHGIAPEGGALTPTPRIGGESDG
ncbi:STAS domain-containing protein [Rhodococcus sp. D2-41]|uniref:STAS domain-containing protein n=1 Tax=Speluncibacter jeojiensis TaxID=2710754 RepID=A0A9X4M3Q5_9ACTN|nr:STAS domain-containing protein [Rhodococcus sp. D2-41]MDG3010887.1 STAS domain-containing protein [Rhodococcus sp. D2-41]MDG3013861.1 STAS domain-containing protein [Corynebacteriales bacterium D3-21]